jgi:hypothetical protein
VTGYSSSYGSDGKGFSMVGASALSTLSQMMVVVAGQEVWIKRSLLKKVRPWELVCKMVVGCTWKNLCFRP